MRARVSSDAAVLDELHACYGWIPSASSVRPSSEVRLAKDAYLQTQNPGVWVKRDVLSGGANFRVCEQPFPYQVPAGTRHLVAWFRTDREPWTDDRLTDHIASAIDARGGGDFVYYSNPKRSVLLSDVDHVQVFWQEPSRMEDAPHFS